MKHPLKIELIQLLKSSPTINAVGERQRQIDEDFEVFLKENYLILGFSSPQIWQQEVFDKHGLLETQNQISSIEKRFVELMRAFITSMDDMVAAQERKTLLSIQGASFILDSLQYKHYYEERDVFKGEFECLYEACRDVINKYNDVQNAKKTTSSPKEIAQLEEELVDFAKRNLQISSYFSPDTLQYDETYFALVIQTAEALQDAYNNFNWDKHEIICYAYVEE